VSPYNLGVPSLLSANSLLAAFQQVDLSKNFYFSYTYDLTNTLQVNLTGTRLATGRDKQTRIGPPTAWGYNDKCARRYSDMAESCSDLRAVVWNHYLLNSAFSGVDDNSNWVLPLIYGFVEQASRSSVNTRGDGAHCSDRD
jgi:hypothetical protein